ncbi:TetR family transcriptional regulator, partial [Burkholderia multivorans]
SPLTDLIAAHPTGTARNELLYRRGLDIIIAGIEARVE